MSYTFNGELAKEYGVNGAIVIDVISDLIKRNKALNEYYVDGHIWVCASVSSFSKMLPFWNTGTIVRTLKKLEDDNVIICENHNNTKCNRTKWYRLNKSIKGAE